MRKKRKLRILLVQPAPFEPGRLGLENVVWLSEPLALISIASSASDHDCRLLDMRLEPDAALNETLLSFQPDLVATTSMTTDCYQAKAILETAKSVLGPKCFTMIGGHHPTLAPEDFETSAVDAICIGEGELTFGEVVDALAEEESPHARLSQVSGIRIRDELGSFFSTPARGQNKALDELPSPARHLIKPEYKKEYFFAIASPMASIETSRGCAFTCNFCAIWEFYQRKVRFMSASRICDELERIEEKYVFFLDDNFLTNRKRLLALCEEIKKRKIKKFFGIQGRTDFVAQNPEIMRRLRDAGLFMVLSGYETNSDDGLEFLRKKNTFENNKKAAEVLRSLGIVSTGIFMVRQDYEKKDFDLLYKTINEMGIGIPLVAILTPLPGTELFKKRRKELLTEDYRLFDLLHSVLPTKLPREEFYREYSRWDSATFPSYKKGVLAAVKRRPFFFLQAIPGIYRYYKRATAYRPILDSTESHLRDEIGITHSLRQKKVRKSQDWRPEPRNSPKNSEVAL